MENSDFFLQGKGGEGYGFRKGRSCHDTVSAVRGYLLKGHKYILDADISIL